jgi:hypothetical protein
MKREMKLAQCAFGQAAFTKTSTNVAPANIMTPPKVMVAETPK